MRSEPARDSHGAVHRWIWTSSDIDDQRQLQLGLERQRDLEQHLMGIVSHDLRNPLQAIALCAEALGQLDTLDAAAARFVLRIQAATQRAAQMISDLLDFTQARLGGGLNIVRRSADLNDVVRGVLDELEATQPTRVLTTTFGGDGRGDFDVDRIAQLLHNLLTNACKYSPEGSAVSVETVAEPQWFSLIVRNLGPPIDPVMLPRIFEPMQRATHAATDRRGRSVGLGLYIVQQIAAGHGGTVTVVSTEQDGTRFTVRLPRVAFSSQGR